MRTLLLTRGAPGSGKSTWIKNNNLEQYTLSADSIRLLYQSPVLTSTGSFAISQKNDNSVWSLLYNLLEERMKRGEFIIVDATHYKSNLLNRYKELVSEYRYRVYIIDFTDVSKEKCLERNSLRDVYKRVPEETIEKMYTVFEEDTEISNKFKVLKKEEALYILEENLLFDYNKYEKIVVLGDIHGCYAPLKEYFNNNPYNEKYGYVFIGDYIDRGIQNKEVLEFLLTIKDYPNVLLLEGNHEKWLKLYSNKDYKDVQIEKEDISILKKYFSKEDFYRLKKNNIKSEVFLKKTLPQIESIDKKDLRQLCRKFGQFAYFTFGKQNYFISHGGIPCVPNLFISID